MERDRAPQHVQRQLAALDAALAVGRITPHAANLASLYIRGELIDELTTDRERAEAQATLDECPPHE